MILIHEKFLAIFKKIRNVAGHVTVEPVIWGYLMPTILGSMALQNLNLEKACRVNKGYGEELCKELLNQDLANGTKEETEIQALVAQVNSWKTPLQYTIPCFLILFAGSWSDKTMKRKILMVLPLIGGILSAFGEIWITHFFLEVSLEWSAVVEAVPVACLGAFPMLGMAVYSYIADNTAEKDRSYRMGILNTFLVVSVSVGTTASGVMLKATGYYGVFITCLFIFTLTLVYTLCRIKDKKKVSSDVVKKKSNPFLEIFQTALKPRIYKKRLRILVLVFTYFLYTGGTQGAFQNNYLFARKKHHFTEMDFSIFSGYVAFMDFTGLTFGTTILINRLQIDDNLLGLLAVIGRFSACILFCFAPNKAWYYTAPIADMMNGLVNTAFRSIASKLVEPDEIGKIYSLYSFMDGIIGALFTYIFSYFYAVTVANFPGAYYILYAAIIFPCIFLFIYLYKLQKRQEIITNTKSLVENATKSYSNSITKL